MDGAVIMKTPTNKLNRGSRNDANPSLTLDLRELGTNDSGVLDSKEVAALHTRNSSVVKT